MAEVLDAAAIAELRAFNVDLERLLGSGPPPESVPVTERRAAAREGRGTFPPPVFLSQAREMTVRGRSGDIRLRVLAPERDAIGIYLYIHGGGWAFGECDLQDPALWELAQATGLCVASVGYRLAPEHPYPAAPDDCEDVARWIVEHGPIQFGTPPVFAIGGASAGAHLSVVTLLRLRDRHGILGAFRAANLIYGAYDLGWSPSARLWGDRKLILTTPSLRWFGEHFVPGLTREQLQEPDISPLYADLEGMPRSLFSIGDQDPLLDDSLFMAARWKAAGNEAKLVVYPEAAHGFTQFPLAATRVCKDSQYQFLTNSCD
jgi:acetyl esterase